jgi:hypothetical protein
MTAAAAIHASENELKRRFVDPIAATAVHAMIATTIQIGRRSLGSGNDLHPWRSPKIAVAAARTIPVERKGSSFG